MKQSSLVTTALMINLDWKLPVNLDLGALCIGRDGNRRLISHEDVGSRLEWPFAHLAHRTMEIGRVKHRREHLVITSSQACELITLIVWDKHAVMSQEASDFCRHPEELSIKAHMQNNMTIDLTFRGAEGNLVTAATIRHGELSVDGTVGLCGPDVERYATKIYETEQC